MWLAERGCYSARGPDQILDHETRTLASRKGNVATVVDDVKQDLHTGVSYAISKGQA